MALALLLAPLLAGRNLLRVLLGPQIELPDAIWSRLNIAWVAFFTLMGALNLWVAYSFPTDIWVNFKLFGVLGLMLAFMVAQGFYLHKHMPQLPPAEADSDAQITDRKRS